MNRSCTEEIEAMTKHQPATPLPWTVTGFRGLDGHAFGSKSCSVVGRTMQHENGASKQNAAYIAHAANAYPKLVEALRETVRDITIKDSAAERQAKALLRELGENTTHCIAGAFVGQSDHFINSGKCNWPECGCNTK